MRRDYYAVLGIAATAGPREVGRAYQRLGRQSSPDVNFWDERARELFDEIADAFRALGDPTGRWVCARCEDVAGADDAVGAGRRGDDVHAVVELSFAEVVRGTRPRIEIHRFSPCAECAASGSAEGGRCPLCLGRGVRRVAEAVGVAIPPGGDSGAQIRMAGEGDGGPFGGPRGGLMREPRGAAASLFLPESESGDRRVA